MMDKFEGNIIPIGKKYRPGIIPHLKAEFDEQMLDAKVKNGVSKCHLIRFKAFHFILFSVSFAFISLLLWIAMIDIQQEWLAHVEVELDIAERELWSSQAPEVAKKASYYMLTSAFSALVSAVFLFLGLFEKVKTVEFSIKFNP